MSNYNHKGKSGRPQLEKAKLEKISQMWQEGHSISAIARNVNVSRITVRDYLKTMGLYSAGSNPAGNLNSETSQPTTNKGVQTAYDMLSNYGVHTGGTDQTELSSMLERIRAYRMDLDRLERNIGKFGESENVDNQIEQIRAIEEQSKQTLEKLGYKTVRSEEPATVEEARKLLEASGYLIQDSRISRGELEKKLEEEKNAWQNDHQIEIDSMAEERKIQAAESIVTTAIDRIVSIFQPVVSGALQEATQKTIDKRDHTKKILDMTRQLTRESPNKDNLTKENPTRQLTKENASEVKNEPGRIRIPVDLPGKADRKAKRKSGGDSID